ncbi:rac GTPase-activating protein 1 [Eudromia elegans]
MEMDADYIQTVRCFEVVRQKCCRLEQDQRRAREQLACAQAERAVLEVKLKHARNQVEVEMKKRHRAEAELEKQERKLQLVFELLLQEPLGSTVLTEEQRSILSTLAGQHPGRTLAPASRSSAVDESCQSLLSHSDISYDRTDDDVDVDTTVVKPLKRKAQERQRVSLAPQIGPVVVAKRHRSSVTPADAGAAGSVPPATLVPRRRSRQGQRLSTRAELTTAWGSGEEQAGPAPGQGSRTEDGSARAPAPVPVSPPPRGPPPPQHQFISKTIIRPEPCAVCGSRVRFGRAACKCSRCQLLVHTKCRERCRGACEPWLRQRAWPRQGVLADFAPPIPPLVPALVVQCVTEVEARGLVEMGLYRVPGAEQLVREWKQRLLQAGDAPPGLGAVADVHVVCGVLKDFLRGLQEPLVTFGLHAAFLQAAAIPDEAACSTALCHVVTKLPPANRDTLAFLMLHLLRVSRSPHCRMDVLNLSRVFGPTLVGHGCADPTPLAIMEDTPRQCQVVARLLALPPDFWRRFVGAEQGKLEPLRPRSPVLGSEHAPRPAEPPCAIAAEAKAGQLSPLGPCCLPSTLRSCVGTAARSPQAPAPRKAGRFFLSPV